MSKYRIFTFSALVLLGAFRGAWAAPFSIAVEGPQSLADVTTHEIRSGNATLGVSDKGGGYINRLVIPGVGDVMAVHAARYGRGGQVSIRDRLHGQKYNPTQAGFTDPAGTHVTVLQEGNLIRLPRRPLSLWNGDGDYDFIEWENLASDPYRKDGGNSDVDGLDESKLAGKQAAEITSEFDFSAEYRDVQDGVKVRIPAFRFYYEISYVRKPGHAISQFSAKTPIYRPQESIADISVEAPDGLHPSTETTLGGVILSATIRGDKDIWNPSVMFSVNKKGILEASRPTGAFRDLVEKGGRDDAHPLVIYSISADPDVGPAVGFFQPDSSVNTYNVMGRSAKDDRDVYLDRRTTAKRMIGSFSRTKDMWLMGVKVDLTGLLSPLEAPSGVYETIRGESFILIGSPAEILTASKSLQPK